MRSRRGLSEKALSSNALSMGLGADGGEFGVSAEAGVVGRRTYYICTLCLYAGLRYKDVRGSVPRGCSGLLSKSTIFQCLVHCQERDAPSRCDLEIHTYIFEGTDSFRSL
jgi:hypothetical protein